MDSGINSVKKSSAVDCPVDFIKIDENRVRVVALIVMLFVFLYLVKSSPITISILLADFVLRAFNQNSHSPLALLSEAIVKLLGLKPKPVDRAPKRFAALVGIVFLSGVLATSFAGLLLTSKIIATVVIVFASLESFLGFCAGCYVYTFLGRSKSHS